MQVSLTIFTLITGIIIGSVVFPVSRVYLETTGDSFNTTDVVGYSVNNGTILKADKPIQLRGVNWFGSETPNRVQHGLWSRNYKEMIAQMRDLGFNSMRIPFCGPTLKQANSTGFIDFNKNSDLRGLDSLAIFDKILAELNAKQMYILLDLHRPGPDCSAISEKWYTNTYSEAQWISNLKLVAERYKNLEYFFAIDLKNEPHGSATWGTGNSSSDWNLAAERAGEAV